MNNDIKQKLDNFVKNGKIPHILFCGEDTTLNIDCLNYLLENINTDIRTRRENTLYVNCAYGKGIKFIREQLKLFAKTNIMNLSSFIQNSQNEIVSNIPTVSNSNNANNTTTKFKSIVLLHADFLTIDAQSALRRCIEQYSHKTRFFMVVSDKDSIIKPILSRFCDIYLNNTNINSFSSTNLIKKNDVSNFDLEIQKFNNSKQRFLKKVLLNINIDNMSYLGMNIFDISTLLYNKGVHFNDFINVLKIIIKNDVIKYGIITYINKIRYEIKNEKLLFINILNVYCLRSNLELENIYPF